VEIRSLVSLELLYVLDKWESVNLVHNFHSLCIVHNSDLSLNELNGSIPLSLELSNLRALYELH